MSIVKHVLAKRFLFKTKKYIEISIHSIFSKKKKIEKPQENFCFSPTHFD